MKGIRWTLIVLAVVAASLRADPPPTYYSAATGLTGGPLKQALHNIVAAGHTVIPYSSLGGPLAVIWRDPANPSNIILSYSRTSVPASSSWNREHLWPRSRGNTDQAGPDDSDLFHVVPTDVSVNAERGNLYFDESDPGDPGYRIPAHPLAPQTSHDSDSWQPAPEERGDIARALFYMDMRYDGSESQTTDFELVSFPPVNAQMGRLNTLLLWNEQDPPDDAERARNDLIYTTYQHNRNPFIDHPEWVAEIWGTGTPGGGGSRPIARVTAAASSAVESPVAAGTFVVSLNQFAGVGGVTVNFAMSGIALPTEYTLGGAGVTFDPETATGSVLIPANFSSATVTLTPVNDGVTEPAEAATLTLADGGGYTFVPDASSSATVTITDAPQLPASWNFNSPPYANPLAANFGAGSISFSRWTGTIDSFGGVSGNAIALVGQAGNGSSIEVNLSMAGYTGLTLSFWTRGTAAGFDTGTWSASTDGVNFTTLAGVNTATRNTTFIQRQVSFASIPGLTNAPSVTLRYTLSGATSTAGNNRLDELTATATQIVSGDTLRTVSIAAADPNASESGPDSGTFVVQLNGLAPAGGLDVTLAFSGSATPPGNTGADYALDGLSSYDPATRSGHVLFAEGQSSASITITPVVDAVTEGAETAIATVAASSGYLVGANSTAIVTIAEPIPNDAFASATILTGSHATSTGTNIGATRETGEPSHFAAAGGHSVWWRWTAPATGVVALSTAGSNFDTILAAYTGSSVAALTSLGSNDDSGGSTTSALAIRVTQGVAYSFVVDGYSQSVGQIAFALDFAPLPAITLSAPVSLGYERGNVPAAVRFTLSNAVALPTTINFQCSGTATLGVDYGSSAGSFTTLAVPAGSDSGDVFLYPYADTNPLEPDETIIVTLLAGSTYQAPPMPAPAVTLTIVDDSPYSGAWIAEHPGLNPVSAAPAGDTDGDGVPSLLEYVADRDPLAPDKAPLLTIEEQEFVDPADGLEKPFAAIRFIRRTDAAGIPLVLETRSAFDAGSWQADGVLVSITPIPGTAREELLFRSPSPIAGPGAAGYFRLRATVP